MARAAVFQVGEVGRGGGGGGFMCVGKRVGEGFSKLVNTCMPSKPSHLIRTNACVRLFLTGKERLISMKSFELFVWPKQFVSKISLRNVGCTVDIKQGGQYKSH